MLKINDLHSFAWSCPRGIIITRPLVVVNRARTQKYAGGCARWWGFHTYTPAKIFKSVFLNRITGYLSHVPLQSFPVKSKTYQLHIINIYRTTCKPVAANFSLLLYKTPKHVNPKFSPTPVFQIGFLTISHSKSEPYSYIFKIILTFAQQLICS